MSYSSLWTIDKDWKGADIKEYRNSHLFAPIVWDILMCKYIPKEERRLEFPYYEDGVKYEYETSFIIWATSLFKKNDNQWVLNEKIHNSEIQFDRVLWELSNLSVFNAKDKEFVADCIEKFVQTNFDYLDIEDNSHIKERFLAIAKDIRELPQDCKYFVFKGTSCDDNVEWWFCSYDEDKDEDCEKKLSDWDKFVCEFTLIENDKVVRFADNLTICKKD